MISLNARYVGALSVGVALLLSTACSDEPLQEGSNDSNGGERAAVTVGSANFPEAVLLGNIYASALEQADIQVERELNIGAREVYMPALERGDIDLLPEYAGSLLNFLTEGDMEATETDPIVEALREELQSIDATALTPSEAQNRNALVVTPETADEYGLETTSDLAPVSGELVAGGDPAAVERADALPGLKRVYDIEFAEYIELDAGGPLTIEALQSGKIDVARLFTTQPVIGENDWVVLEDDGNLIPSENIIPVIREDALDPDVQSVLDAVSEALTLDELLSLNRRTELENEDPDRVADDWVSGLGLGE